MSQAMYRTEGWTSDTRLPADRPLFTAGSRSYDRRDVVVAAILRGEWQGLEQQLRQGLACVQRLRKGEGEPDSLDLEQAAQEFRYAGNLITAEETEAWLTRSGLTFEAWTGYLERSRLRQAWANEIEDVVSHNAVGDDELRSALQAEAVCSGELQRFAETLAGRAAVYERAAATPCAEAGGLDDVLIGRVRRECAFALGWSEAAGPSSPDWNARIAEIARIEATFQACVRKAITPEAVQAQIGAHRLDWMRLRWRSVLLRDEQAAQEAALCLRLDGEALEDVAARARAAVREEEPLLESVSAEVRAAVVSARPNDLLGPWPDAGGFRVAVLLAKAHPSESDGEVRRRAEEEIVASLVAATMKHVRWHERL